MSYPVWWQTKEIILGEKEDFPILVCFSVFSLQFLSSPLAFPSYPLYSPPTVSLSNSHVNHSTIDLLYYLNPIFLSPSTSCMLLSFYYELFFFLYYLILLYNGVSLWYFYTYIKYILIKYTYYSFILSFLPF
jgi:hypothetical protein